MLSAFFYRYLRVLRRSRTDTMAMFVRPLLSGVILLVFAQTIPGAPSLSTFMVVSVMISNVIMNTILGAAYESRMDLADSKRELIKLAPGGLREYCLIQALTQGVIASLQSLLVSLALLPWLHGSLTLGPMFAVSCLILALSVITVAALTAQHSTLRGSYVGVSFGVGIALTFSGVFYPAEALPLWARLASSANPVTYLVSGLRSAFGDFETGQWLGITYAGIVTILAVIFFTRKSLG